MAGHRDNPNIAPVSRTQVRPVNAGSQQSAAFGSDTVAVTLWADVDDAWIKFGANPTAVAAAGDGNIALPAAGVPITLPVSPGQKFAGITEGSAGKIKCLEHPNV